MYLLLIEMTVLFHIYSSQTLFLHLKCSQFVIYVDQTNRVQTFKDPTVFMFTAVLWIYQKL